MTPYFEWESVPRVAVITGPMSFWKRDEHLSAITGKPGQYYDPQFVYENYAVYDLEMPDALEGIRGAFKAAFHHVGNTR